MVQSCIFPDPLKLADVSPVYKDGTSTSKSNYRPISVLRGGSRQNRDIRTFFTIEPHPMTTPTKVMSVKLNWLQYVQGGIQ